MFTVQTEEIPHQWKTQWSWGIIWRVPVSEEVGYQYEENKKQEYPLEVKSQ